MSLLNYFWLFFHVAELLGLDADLLDLLASVLVLSCVCSFLNILFWSQYRYCSYCCYISIVSWVGL